MVPSLKFIDQNAMLEASYCNAKHQAQSTIGISFVQCAPSLPQIGKKKLVPSVCTSQAASSSRRRPRPTRCASNSSNDDDNNEEDEDPEVSRRVFMAGISVTSVVTAAAGYRFLIGEDIESRIYTRFTKRFPRFFPTEKTPEERRKPLNAAFAKSYFAAAEEVAVRLKLISADELRREEQSVKDRAYNLFFDNISVAEDLSNASWLNFVLYSRLHVISQKTSPKSRIEFADQLARNTMQKLKTTPFRQTKEEAKLNSERWIKKIDDLLNELVELGWISGFRIEEFDGGPGSSWQDESRASLTIYSFDPVTLQAAQLIGEEQREEISPKPSGWIKAYLKDMGIKATLEDYYLDDAYRPDPDQFKPSQLATQFDLSV